MSIEGGNESFSSDVASESADLAVSNLEQSQQLEDAFSEKALDEAVTGSEESIEKEEVQLEEEAPENDQFSKKFAALSKREKSLRDRESQYADKLAQVEAKLLELEERSRPAEEPVIQEESIESLLRKNPMKALEKYGWDYKKLTESQLNDGEIPMDVQMKLMRSEMEDKYKNEIDVIRNELLERDKKSEEKNYNEVINNFMTDLTGYINEGGEKYELIQANDAVDLVFDVIDDHYKDTGRILSNTEASEQVEAYLMEEAQKLLKLRKLQPKTSEGLGSQKPVQEKRQSQTLSNTLSAQVPARTDRALSREESLAKAASLMKWDI